PGGSSRDITLPDASLMAGDGFYINNAADGEENPVVKSGITTVGTVNQNEVGHAYSDGSAWYILIGATTCTILNGYGDEVFSVCCTSYSVDSVSRWNYIKYPSGHPMLLPERHSKKELSTDYVVVSLST